MRSTRSFSVMNAVSSSTILGLCVSSPKAPPIMPTAVDCTMVCFISLKNFPGPLSLPGDVTGTGGGMPGGWYWPWGMGT